VLAVGLCFVASLTACQLRTSRADFLRYPVPFSLGLSVLLGTRSLLVQPLETVRKLFHDEDVLSELRPTRERLSLASCLAILHAEAVENQRALNLCLKPETELLFWMTSCAATRCCLCTPAFAPPSRLQPLEQKVDQTIVVDVSALFEEEVIMYSIERAR
jgi:hypothetical protein